MRERETNLARLLRPVVGDDHVITESGLSIDGLAPLVLVKPGSVEEVAGCLRICAEEEAAVVPAGLMTWLETGNPLRRADVVLSLERMNRIIDYSPPDLTVTVEAGVTIRAFNEVAKVERQWLPLEPPGCESASLGAIAACASTGPLRLGFGSPRDYVIGLRLAHADGSDSKSGGKVVKNVAGYDMNKLYVGSFGTLAVLTELTFKLRPLPESVATVVVTSNRWADIVETAQRVLASELSPASVFLTKGVLPDSKVIKAGEWALLIRFADSAAAVRHQIAFLPAIARGSEVTALGGDADGLWALVRDVDRLRQNAVRLSVPISMTASVLEETSAIPDRAVAADMGIGTFRLAFDAERDLAIDLIGRLRSKAEELGGSLVIERADLTVRRKVDAWGQIGEVGMLMQSTKDRFDPHSLLNPGRFACGI